jgi:cytoskeletal protein CcmA (bactofilin family)
VFIVGPGIRIWGMIHSGEPVEVRGFVDGSIIAPTVHVIAQAMVIGDLVAVAGTGSVMLETPGLQPIL